MIPKNLKVGDTFLDGQYTYKVTKVLDNGFYESQCVDEEKPIGFSVTEEKVTEATDYNSLPYAQLKKLCAERGLNAIGSKADLVSRLEG